MLTSCDSEMVGRSSRGARGKHCFDGHKASSTSTKKINRADPMHRSCKYSFLANDNKHFRPTNVLELNLLYEFVCELFIQISPPIYL